MADRVVVTGVGVVAPNGIGKEAFAGALREGTSGIRFQQQLKDCGMACHVAGVPRGTADLRERYLGPDELLATNSSMTYAAIAAVDAWEDAGLERAPADAGDVDWDSGAILGTVFGGMDTIGDKLVPGTDARRVARLGSTLPEQTQASGGSARVAGLLALGNRVTTNSTACATGTDAIVESYQRIRAGLAMRMLAGGTEGDSKYPWAGFDAMRVLCRTHNDEPETASRPMSASAAGFVPAAGAGVLLLESLGSARARNAKIYAEVLGGHVNCGGHRMGGSMTAPNPEGVRRCIRAAIDAAGVTPEQVDAINGHLTATIADVREIESWRAALDLAPGRMPYIQATKSLIGHALGAAGGIECVACVLELSAGFVHGSANNADLHPALEAYRDRIPQRAVPVPDIQVIAKASFGFGDVNACVVFRRFDGA